MAKDFIHLHVHSQYSIYKGLGRIRDLVNKAISDGMPGMALTDLGNMFGIKEFHDYVTGLNKKRKEKGEEPFKPILGCEMCVEMDYGFVINIIVLAKNYQGYSNLCKLVSHSWTNGFSETPQIRKFDLICYREGLIVISGSFSSEQSDMILNDIFLDTKESIWYFQKIFGEDYYLALERYGLLDNDDIVNRERLNNQDKINSFLLEQAKENDIKVVCTNDVYFLEKENAEAYGVLRCINKEIEHPDKNTDSNHMWFKTIEEMSGLFKDIPEALSNTINVLNKVELYDIDNKQILPLYPISQRNESEFDYLKGLTLHNAYKIFGEKLPSEVEDRLQMEFDVIKEKNFATYFLVIQDLIDAIRKEFGTLVGPGRGSVSGSLVCYCLGITTIDPLKYGLLFERFVNLNRDVLPDIDIDFDEGGRSLAEKYLFEKYGKECCAHIVAFNRRDSINTIKDVARVEEVPLCLVDKLCDEILYRVPSYANKNLSTALKYTPELREIESSTCPSFSKTVKYSKFLEGAIHGLGIHACGIVVCEGNVSNWGPVCTISNPKNDNEKVICTQYDGHYVESTGLVKYDLLELDILTVISNTLSLILLTHGTWINLDKIPIDDSETFELFQDGKTVGVFEFDSENMRNYLRLFHPTVFGDLVALNTIFRPGPMELIPSLIARKNGSEEIKYDIPCMERYLKDSYGITIYQEQIMNLSRLLANFTREESDILRKALGKKKHEVLDEMKVKFVEGGKQYGHDSKILEKIWNDWENKYGLYAYCKSHAVCYTWLAYQTAYLKAHYPNEYMSALLKFSMKDWHEFKIIQKECERMEIQLI